MSNNGDGLLNDSEDEGLEGINSDLESDNTDEREEAYRERKDSELEHEKKQDEGIIQANRRSVLALAGSAVAGGGGILYGIWDQSGEDFEGGRQPAPGNGDGNGNGNGQPPTGELPNRYTITDAELRSVDGEYNALLEDIAQGEAEENTVYEEDGNWYIDSASEVTQITEGLAERLYEETEG